MTSENEVDGIFSPIQLIVVFLIGLLIASPFIAHLAMGWGVQPALEVGEPVSSVSSDATVVGYESLQPSSQDAFREASGHRRVILDEPFPTADYVRLNGQYHPITETQMLPPLLALLFVMSWVAGGLLLPVLIVGIYKNSHILQQAFE